MDAMKTRFGVSNQLKGYFAWAGLYLVQINCFLSSVSSRHLLRKKSHFHYMARFGRLRDICLLQIECRKCGLLNMSHLLHR